MPKPKLPRVCFDRVLPSQLMLHQAVKRPRPGQPARAISPIGKSWINGSRLRVRFIGGSAAQRNIAREQAAWWTAHANLAFDFNNAPDAEIRIAFDSNDGAWSYVGTDCRGIPASEPTMNLGFLDGGTAGHEFGHAIGLAHEHSSPFGGIQWNEQAVIQALAGPPNFWTEAEARHNVLHKYQASQVKGTQFDPASIMLYFFPAEWTLNGVATSQNEVLSTMDKDFVASAKMYPKSTPAPEVAAVELKVNAARRTSGAIGRPMEEDLYRFDVKRAGRHIVDTRGRTDVVMKLFGPDSPTNLLKEDDDSGVDTNARIVADLIPGRYYVQIRHWSKATGTGSYTIRVASA